MHLKLAGVVLAVSAHEIQHVVHLMLENRAFDTMFGYLTHNPDIDNLVGKQPYCNLIDPTNPKSSAICTSPTQPDTTKFNPDHEYSKMTTEIYGSPIYNSPNVPLPDVAPMNGFVYQASMGAFKGASTNDLQQVMAGFDPKNIPVQATLASEFTIFDRWFAALPGPTQPNRIAAHCAGTHGMYTNSQFEIVGNPCRSIFEDLSDAGLTWKNYFEEEPSIIYLRNIRLKMFEHSRPFSQFYRDAQAGTLANYTFLEPNYGQLPGSAGKEDDGHPGAGYIHNSEYLVKKVYEALRNSPNWKNTLFLITYDEHGGFFDHVPTPRAPNPDGIVTTDLNDKNIVYKFDRLGVRVPVTVISPWVAKGAVVHEPNGPQPDSQFTHASIPATIRSIFKLSSPPLTAREAWAGNFESILLNTPRDDCPLVMPAVNMNGF
ncbi:hypothetical protein HK103_006697 [Boothiomyces macroporosus]|uniref:Phosphoesterase n=1 Tax=Boothiomyces macroporosus TaxID=261099 RepID=A0AAD5UDD5_9FUNG|nr:hypothetical protein HK103_006697 [Boothiomyces macroporosus]